MTPPAPEAPRSWRAVNYVLGGVAVLLALLTGVLLAGSAGGTSPSPAETVSQRHAQVSDAARAETLAFLTVDYRDMDPLIEEVLDGATGEFAEEYAQAREELEASAEEERSVSTGEVRAVGVAELDKRSAVVYVAADGEVENRSTSGEPQVRPYRFELTMVREDGRWLTSGLRILGSQ